MKDRVLFVTLPPLRFFRSIDIILPLGVGVLTTYLRRHGITVEQVDLHAESFSGRFGSLEVLQILKSPENLLAFLNDPDDELFSEVSALLEKMVSALSLSPSTLVGFSILGYYSMPICLGMCAILRRKGFETVIGGPGVTDAFQLFRNEGRVDHVVEGPGEPFFREYFNLGDETRDTFPTFVTRVIRAHTVPGLGLILPYRLTKGCVYDCSFCEFPMKKSYEYTPTDRVLADLWRMVEKYGSRKFNFLDDNVNNNLIALEGICKGLVSEGLDIRWGAMGRAMNPKKYLLSMARSGCCFLRYGIETGSTGMLKIYNKYISLDIVRKCVMNSSVFGIQVHGLFMVNGPYETVDKFRTSVEYVRSILPFLAQGNVSIFYLGPRSPIGRNQKAFGVERMVTAEEERLVRYGYPINRWREINGRTGLEIKKDGLARERLFRAMIFKGLLRNWAKDLRKISTFGGYVLDRRIPSGSTHLFFI